MCLFDELVPAYLQKPLFFFYLLVAWVKESEAKILSLQLYTKLEHRAPVCPDGKFWMEICSQALHRWPVHEQKARHIRTLLCTQTPGGSSDGAA